ncbi:hypothetical protein J6590_040192 [Homalodisca vitripennis]|nr:hypothetical protein J6590_040192 [Homalodisca vitripennis]
MDLPPNEAKRIGAVAAPSGDGGAQLTAPPGVAGERRAVSLPENRCPLMTGSDTSPPLHYVTPQILATVAFIMLITEVPDDGHQLLSGCKPWRVAFSRLKFPEGQRTRGVRAARTYSGLGCTIAWLSLFLNSACAAHQYTEGLFVECKTLYKFLSNVNRHKQSEQLQSRV